MTGRTLVAPPSLLGRDEDPRSLRPGCSPAHLSPPLSLSALQVWYRQPCWLWQRRETAERLPTGPAHLATGGDAPFLVFRLWVPQLRVSHPAMPVETSKQQRLWGWDSESVLLGGGEGRGGRGILEEFVFPTASWWRGGVALQLVFPYPLWCPSMNKNFFSVYFCSCADLQSLEQSSQFC